MNDYSDISSYSDINDHSDINDKPTTPPRKRGSEDISDGIDEELKLVASENTAASRKGRKPKSKIWSVEGPITSPDAETLFNNLDVGTTLTLNNPVIDDKAILVASDDFRFFRWTVANFDYNGHAFTGCFGYSERLKISQSPRYIFEVTIKEGRNATIIKKSYIGPNVDPDKSLKRIRVALSKKAVAPPAPRTRSNRTRGNIRSNTRSNTRSNSVLSVKPNVLDLVQPEVNARTPAQSPLPKFAPGQLPKLAPGQLPSPVIAEGFATLRGQLIEHVVIGLANDPAVIEEAIKRKMNDPEFCKRALQIASKSPAIMEQIRAEESERLKNDPEFRTSVEKNVAAQSFNTLFGIKDQLSPSEMDIITRTLAGRGKK
jgi:hypothetical protein